ncbi:MAG TPA: peptidoglycan editing factor PgeF [Porticoccaceae bacterium]|jgi:YfiH family protein|nr:peptidoglycan editing factor PgeF [Porticoccaceae bacterium]
MVEASPLFFIPDWPVPANVRAAISLRLGGSSSGAFTNNNMALHVGDDQQNVIANRQALTLALNLSEDPHWLNQVHGTNISYAPDRQPDVAADGSFSDQSGFVCTVMTADCLPILLCNYAGNQVAAVHAGWRGLANGIVAEAVSRFTTDSPIMAYLGPAIGPDTFEVGADVYHHFISRVKGLRYKQQIENAFVPNPRTPGRYFANLYTLGRAALSRSGVTEVYGRDECTFSNPERFYSYRRDSITGRNASLIWLTSG